MTKTSDNNKLLKTLEKKFQALTSKKVRLEFDVWSNTYDRSAVENNWIAPKIIYTEIKKHAPTPKTILDLGIGTGILSELFKNTEGVSPDITGIDISYNMLKKCEAKKIASNLIWADISRPLELPNNHFDIVMSCGALEFVPSLSTLASEVSRIIKPNGLIAFAYTSKDQDFKEDYSLKTTDVITLFKGFTPLQAPQSFTGYKYQKKYDVCFDLFIARSNKTDDADEKFIPLIPA